MVIDIGLREGETRIPVDDNQKILLDGIGKTAEAEDKPRPRSGMRFQFSIDGVVVEYKESRSGEIFTMFRPRHTADYKNFGKGSDDRDFYGPCEGAKNYID
jgi:hypothetical protein